MLTLLKLTLTKQNFTISTIINPLDGREREYRTELEGIHGIREVAR